MIETPENRASVRNIQRIVAFLGIFLILASQFLIFSSPGDTIVFFPPYTWMAGLGVFVLILSQLIRPTAFFQKLSGLEKHNWKMKNPLH